MISHLSLSPARAELDKGNGRKSKIDAFLLPQSQTYLVAARGAARVHEPISMAHLSVCSRWASWRARRDWGNCDGARTMRARNQSSARSRRCSLSISSKTMKELVALALFSLSTLPASDNLGRRSKARGAPGSARRESEGNERPERNLAVRRVSERGKKSSEVIPSSFSFPSFVEST